MRLLGEARIVGCEKVAVRCNPASSGRNTTCEERGEIVTLVLGMFTLPLSKELDELSLSFAARSELRSGFRDDEYADATTSLLTDSGLSVRESSRCARRSAVLGGGTT